jgi:hypothetical protein
MKKYSDKKTRIHAFFTGFSYTLEREEDLWKGKDWEQGAFFGGSGNAPCSFALKIGLLLIV